MQNKKLLILGGIALANEIIDACKELGIDVYVTDYLENSPAKAKADKSFLVSTTDIDAVTQLIKLEGIDGVLTGFIDLLLPYYVDICEQSGLPCYATKEQIDILTDKDKFKELCRKFDIAVVEEYQTKTPLDEQIFKSFEYPILLKPADNSGGKGITICKNADEYLDNYHKTLSFSKIGKVLIERYVQAQEVSIFYYIQNGEIFLTAMGDRHVQHFNDELIPLPIAYTFPSLHLNEYVKDIHLKVEKMFKSLDMKNGMVFIQSFVESGKCVFYEIGYRLTGSLEYKIIEHESNLNPLKSMISFAVGNQLDTSFKESISPNFNKFYCNVTILSKPGLIGKISTTDEIMKISNVLDVFYSYNEGDKIAENTLGTLGQVVARIFAFADTKEELKSKILEIQDAFCVNSITGESMIIPSLNIENL